MDQREENIVQIYDGDRYLQYPIVLCSKTSSPEKNLCLNMECKMEKKLHCYECICKEHSGNNTFPRLSDFEEVGKFMSKIAKKMEEKELIYNKLIEQCKRQKKQIIEKIENDVQSFILNLTDEKEKNNKLKKYSKENHQELLSLYFEKESTCTKKLENKKKKLEQQVKQHIYNFLSDTDMQEERQRQSDHHESECKKIFNKLFNNPCFQISFILILIVSVSFNFYQYTNEESQKLNRIKELQIVENYNLIISLLGEIHVDFPVSELIYFSPIFDFPIDNSYTEELKIQLDELHNNNSNPIICIGIYFGSYSGHFDFVACDYASEVFVQINPLLLNLIDNGVRLENETINDSQFRMRIYMYEQ